ncbi:MAG: tyrosine/phenylalanine carboxypeptidase domain-containing protein, partial [Candidatus Nanohaloarchaea archaeon]
MISNEKQLENKIVAGKPINVPEDRPVEALFRFIKQSTNLIRLLEPKIDNRQTEKQRFLRNEDYKPELEFSELEYNQEQFLKLLNQAEQGVKKIDSSTMEEYNAETVTAEEFQKFLKQSIEEIKLRLELAENIHNEETWRKCSEKIWPMIDKKQYKKSREKIQELEPGEETKKLDAEDVKKLFQQEIKSLGISYDVETRKVSGCQNLPGDRKLIVAEGENGERRYSREEAQTLATHETFHVARAVNGYKASEKTGLPPFLGVFTPFYDSTEEGGAVFRELETGKISDNKRFDYHLRLIAAYKIHGTENFREEFQRVVDELTDLGASRERAFDLLVRNRQALRHHIYWNGVKQWKQAENKDKLLLGKLNSEWSEKFWEEAEAGGMIQKP